MFPPSGQFLVFLSIVAVIVITPGPNLFLLLGIGPGRGRGVGLLAALGICAAILSHAALALVGVGALVATSAVLFTALKVMGAGYLIWMGIRSLLSLRRAAGLVVGNGGGRSALSAPKAFARGYLTNILNPKPAIFYVAVFPQFLSPDLTGFYVKGAALALAHAAVALLFYGTVVLVMSRLVRVLSRPAVSRAVQSLSGLALILLGGRLLMARAPA